MLITPLPPKKSDCSSKAEQCLWNVNWGPEYPPSPSPLNEQIEFIWALTAPRPLPLGRTEASIVHSAPGFAAICFRDPFLKRGDLRGWGETEPFSSCGPCSVGVGRQRGCQCCAEVGIALH